MNAPQVGDRCKADPEVAGEMREGVITRIVDGLAWSDLLVEYGNEFCGDVPTRKEDDLWVFDSF